MLIAYLSKTGIAIFAAVGLTSGAVAGPEIFAPDSVSGSESTLFKGSFSPDGNGFYFFRKVSDGDEDYRIFVTHRQDGEWIESVQVDLGGGHSDLYPTISPDGNTMVFASYRPVPGAGADVPNANLWLSRRKGDDWDEPEYLAGFGSPKTYEAGPNFAPDGALHFASTSEDWSETTHYQIQYKDGNFVGDMRAVEMQMLKEWQADRLHFWGATLSPIDNVWIIEFSPKDGSGRPGPADLYFAKKTKDGWDEPKPLAGGVNRPGSTENFVLFSADGEDLLFVRDFTGYYRLPLSDALGLR